MARRTLSGDCAAYDPVVPGVVFLQHSATGIADRLFFGTEIGRFSVPVLAASSFALATSSAPDLVIELIPSNTGPITDIGSILFGMEEPTTRTLIEFGTQGAYRQVPGSAPTLSNMELRFRMNTYLYNERPYQKLVGRTRLPTVTNSYFIGVVTDADWALRIVLLKLGTSDNIFQLSVTVQTGGRMITEIGDLAIDPHQAEANVVVLGHEPGSGDVNPLRRFGSMPALNTVLQSAAEIVPMAATPVAPLWAADALSQDYDMVVSGRFQSKTESQSWVLATAQRGNPPQCYALVGMQLSRC